MESKTKQYVNSLITRIIKDIESYPQSASLSSIILTGSLGRDEGTFHLDPETLKVVLDSDVEIALVYKSGKKKDAEMLKSILIESYKEDMNPMTISEARVKNGYNFNYSILPPRKSSIFMYDLYNGSKTIWGDDLLNKKVAPYDKYEAKRIVANRIGELTCIQCGADDKERLVVQWKGKLILAIGSAYCILNNAYKSRYVDQRDYIVSQADKLAAAIDENFVEDYDKTFAFLRKGRDVYDVPIERIIGYVNKTKHLFYKEGVRHPEINSLSRKMKYMLACIRSNAKLNPLTCEVKIIDRLIDEFVDGDDDVLDAAKDWKNILY